MSRMSYEDVCIVWDALLDRILVMQQAWPRTHVEELVAYRRQGQEHPNDVAYTAERARIYNEVLGPTGWTDDELMEEAFRRSGLQSGGSSCQTDDWREGFVV